MGDWTIVIQGNGPQNNAAPNDDGDADKMLQQFLLKLKQNGQKLSHASINCGNRQEYKNLPELS